MDLDIRNRDMRKEYHIQRIVVKRTIQEIKRERNCW